MVIEKLSIGRFGCLCDVEMPLKPGLNVILGPNESGKSTVAAFIRYILYGFGSAVSAEDISEREKRVNWESATAEGSMEIRLQSGRRYRLERKTVAVPQLGRMGYRESSSIIDLSGERQQAPRSLPGNFFFSVPEQVYLNTAFIGQTDGARVNEGEMNQAIENLLFSGDERVSSLRALRMLREARDSLQHPSGVGGAIYEMRAQAESLRIRLTRAMRTNALILHTESELHQYLEKEANSEKERNRLDDIERSYHIYQKIQTFDRLHELENRYEAAAAELEKLRAENRNGDFLPDEQYLTALGTAERVCEIARQNYLRSAEKLKTVREEAVISPESEELMKKTEAAGGAERVEEEYEESHRAQKILYRFRTAFLVLAVLLAGAATFFWFSEGFGPVAGIFFACAAAMGVVTLECHRARLRRMEKIRARCEEFGAVSGADLLCKLRSVAYTAASLEEKKSSIRQAEENLEISHQNFVSLRKNLTEETEKWHHTPSPGSPAEKIGQISEEVRAFLAEEKRLAEAAAELRGQVMALRDEVGNESEVTIRSMVSPEKREAIKQINYKVIEEGLSYYRNTCENLHAKAEELKEKLRGYLEEAENPADLRMDLSETEERISSMQRRHRAYAIACDAVENASARLRAEISPRLSRYLSRLMDVATEGEYRQMTVGNRLGMTYEDGDAQRVLANMSGATQDIAYIALRLSLIDMLYKEKPPVCFDESFSRQDDDRIGPLLRALAEVSEDGMQSILFTCHPREAKLVERLNPGSLITLKGEELE